MKRGELWAILGAIASVIGIITFLTGKHSIYVRAGSSLS
jgi:hypothetical protein